MQVNTLMGKKKFWKLKSGPRWEFSCSEDDPVYSFSSDHFIFSLNLQSEAGMCVNLSQPVSCSSSFFLSSSLPSLPCSTPPSLHPLPSLWFELDNENNEFGVCFFLSVCLTLPHFFLFILLALTLRLSWWPRVALFRPCQQPPLLCCFISFLSFSSVF